MSEIAAEGLEEAVSEPEESRKIVFRCPEEGRLGTAWVRALFFSDPKKPMEHLDQWNCLDQTLPVVFERLCNWREGKLECVHPKASGFLWVARFEIDSDHRGQGFGSTCIMELSRRAWEDHGLVALVAVNPINASAIKSVNERIRAAEKIRAVYEAAGFSRLPSSQLVMAWTGMNAA